MKTKKNVIDSRGLFYKGKYLTANSPIEVPGENIHCTLVSEILSYRLIPIKATKKKGPKGKHWFHENHVIVVKVRIPSGTMHTLKEINIL